MGCLSIAGQSKCSNDKMHKLNSVMAVKLWPIAAVLYWEFSAEVEDTCIAMFAKMSVKSAHKRSGPSSRSLSRFQFLRQSKFGSLYNISYFLDWKNIYQFPGRVTVDTKTRAFQYKILTTQIAFYTK